MRGRWVMTIQETPTVITNGKVTRETLAPANYIVKRCFFPSHGRISRRVNHRLGNGEQFVGFIPSFWWGRFCAFLVYARSAR
jgi:hypothetical protein